MKKLAASAVVGLFAMCAPKLANADMSYCFDIAFTCYGAPPQEVCGPVWYCERYNDWGGGGGWGRPIGTGTWCELGGSCEVPNPGLGRGEPGERPQHYFNDRMPGLTCSSPLSERRAYARNLAFNEFYAGHAEDEDLIEIDLGGGNWDVWSIQLGGYGQTMTIRAEGSTCSDYN
jgi:hypothetical protein